MKWAPRIKLDQNWGAALFNSNDRNLESRKLPILRSGQCFKGVEIYRSSQAAKIKDAKNPFNNKLKKKLSTKAHKLSAKRAINIMQLPTTEKAAPMISRLVKRA
jgi:hypothetical protein